MKKKKKSRSGPFGYIRGLDYNITLLLLSCVQADRTDHPSSPGGGRDWLLSTPVPPIPHLLYAPGSQWAGVATSAGP